MKCVLMFPRDRADGEYLTRLDYFAARRARTLKNHEELWQEAFEDKNMGQITQFLDDVIGREWALDVLEMNIFMYDIEEVPSWLMVEFLRHRLVARDWSFEQRSKRAVQGARIPTINPFVGSDMEEQFEILVEHSRNLMETMHRLNYPPERIRYAALEGSVTSFVCAANARALHHLFTLRGSSTLAPSHGGKAAEEFQELVGIMYEQAKEVCPWIFQHVLEA